MKKNIFSLSVVLGGLLFGLGLHFLVKANVSRCPVCGLLGNYDSSSLLSFSPLPFFGYLFGAYLVIIFFWFFSRGEKDFVPLWVLVGYGIGGSVGNGVAYLLLSKSVVLRWIVPSLVTLAGVRIFCQIEKKMPATPEKRRVLAAGSLAVFGLPLMVGMWGFKPFPADSPISVRHAWAVAKFGKSYEEAEACIRNCSGIKQKIGDVVVMAPAPRSENHFFSSINGQGGDYTIETQGTKGSGIYKVYVAWGEGGDTVDCGCKPENDLFLEN